MVLVTTDIYPLSLQQTVYDVVIVAVVAACTKFQLIIVVGTLMWEELGEIALRLAYGLGNEVQNRWSQNASKKQ